MSRIDKLITNNLSYYVETGLRHGYPLEELMWVVLSAKEIIDRELRLQRHTVTMTNILKQQHDIMVERYKKKLKGNEESIQNSKV